MMSDDPFVRPRRLNPGLLCCPDCSKRTLWLIENTEPDALGEFKEVRTCDLCENIVYIVRKK
jgi:uncharacterized protein YbaR (Trm112 family)